MGAELAGAYAANCRSVFTKLLLIVLLYARLAATWCWSDRYAPQTVLRQRVGGATRFNCSLCGSQQILHMLVRLQMFCGECRGRIANRERIEHRPDFRHRVKLGQEYDGGDMSSSDAAVR